MDIKGTTSKIVACSPNSPCTASVGNVCTAPSLPLDGVVCSLPACPTIYTSDHASLKGTGGWNVWSESCVMSTTFNIGIQFDEVSLEFSAMIVKIKKSSSMSGELIIDREATSGTTDRHFNVDGKLELEDVTLTGGYAVSSFVLFVLLKYSFFGVTSEIV